jgi:hypothetical protein
LQIGLINDHLCAALAPNPIADLNARFLCQFIYQL